MNAITLLEICGFVCAFLATLFSVRLEGGLPREVRPSLVALLSAVTLLHCLDVLEWAGLEHADWFGDTFKVFIPVAWLAFLFSVTRAQLTTDLQVTAGQLQVFLENDTMAIAIVSDGKWVHCNQTWLTLHQMTAPMAGQAIEDTCGPLGKTWNKLSRDALSSGHVLQGTLPATDERGPLEWSVRPWLGVDGMSGSIIVAGEPSLDPSAAGRPSQPSGQPSALETIGAAASGVAHDINNLLTVISMHSEVLHLPQGSDPELTKNSLDSIHQAINMASSMTRGLLTFSKLKPLELGPLDLSALVSASAGLLADSVKGRATLEVRAEPSIWIRGNTSALHQVLLNLVVNAKDALPGFGVITIHVHSAPQAAILAVEDTGSGIPPEVLEHMFEPFFTTKQQKGTGLGLAVVERLVRSQSAQISVKSVLGKGTKFIITFPSAGTGSHGG